MARMTDPFMIVDDNLTTYIHSLEPDGPEWLAKIRSYAQEKNVPVIRREMEPFLKVLLNISRPGRILEIGAGIGYSALFMSHVLPQAQIITIENYEPRLRDCRRFLADREGITLMEGDGLQIIRQMRDQVDMIFLDAAKGQYIQMLPDIKRLLIPGGFLLADNVLQDGTLARSRYIIPRRQRTIHSRMREFLWEMKHCPEFDASVITIGDGVLLGIRK